MGFDLPNYETQLAKFGVLKLAANILKWKTITIWDLASHKPGYDELLGSSVPSYYFDKSLGDFLTGWAAGYPGLNTENKKFHIRFYGLEPSVCRVPSEPHECQPRTNWLCWIPAFMGRELPVGVKLVETLFQLCISDTHPLAQRGRRKGDMREQSSSVSLPLPAFLWAWVKATAETTGLQLLSRVLGPASMCHLHISYT